MYKMITYNNDFKTQSFLITFGRLYNIIIQYGVLLFLVSNYIKLDGVAPGLGVKVFCRFGGNG